MRFIDNLFSKLGYERARNFRRSGPGFGAAQVTRLTADFTTSELSADSELRQDLKRLRARVRKMANDYCYAKKFLAMCRTNICGRDGFNFRNKAKDADRIVNGALIPGKPDIFANKVIQESFAEWCKMENCTVTGEWTFPDATRLAVSALFTDGEMMVRLVKGFEGNPFKFAIQLIESDHLDIELNRTARDGSEIRMGKEFDKWKRPVAYHLLKSNPNDNFYPSSAGQKYQRIPASEIRHPFLPRRIGQSRGYPPMATPMTQMNQLWKASEAEVVATREAACQGGFIETSNGDQGYQGPVDELGNKVMEMEPGLVQELALGQTFKQYDPKHPNGNFSNFYKSTLREIAAGLEHISYNTFGNDMESVNFASGKLGIDEERHGWEVLQEFVADYFLEPIFEAWLESAMMTGIVPLPFAKFKKFNAPCFTGRRWTSIDPEKDARAKVLKLNSGLTSRSRLLAEDDIERDELDQEIEDDNKSAETHGLKFKEIEPEPDPIELEEAKAKLQPEPAAKE